MGKTKIKTIDDSVKESPESRVKSQEKKVSRKQEDSLVAKLKEELGITEEAPTKTSEAPAQSTDKSPEEPQEKKAAKNKPQEPGKLKPRSKKYQESIKDLDKSKFYPIPEAVELAKKLSFTKFPGTLEAHINTAQTGIRGLITLPFASGKKMRILAFGKDAENSGADKVGSDSIIEEIGKGKIDFDIIITTPEWMPKLLKIAKNLGPRGLLPNPKNGTIASPSADGLKKAVESFQAGKTEYKTEPKAQVIHVAMGKLNQPTEELTSNIKLLLQTLGKTRIKKVTLSPTMGSSVKIDLNSF